jgi:tripartite-type tricarboxylate transporter receptor subunit TctC
MDSGENERRVEMKRSGIVITIIFGMALIFLLFSAGIGEAQYPTKPITFIVPYPAGGGADISFRALVKAAGAILSQHVVIENHGGGSSSIGLAMVKMRKPDGYNLGMVALGASINQYMRKVPYDMLQDYSIVMQYGIREMMLVVPDVSPWKTMKEFLDHSKANPGKIRYSTTGPAAPAALVMLQLGKLLQIDWKPIPFEGGPPALAAILGGHVEAYATTLHCKAHIQSGRLRLLASFGEKRMPGFSEVPTLLDLGYPISLLDYMALVGPKGLSPQIVATLDRAFKKAIDDPNFLKACEMVDHIPTYRNPQETARLFQQTNKQVEEIIREQNLGGK